MSSPQVTWDAPQSAPQVKWDEEQQPGFLDKEIPLSSYGNATLSGVQSIGRGVRSAVRGVGKLLDPSADEAGNSFASEGAAYPLIRAGTGLLDTAKQAKQIPAALHDINQSSDPLGHYAHAAQETAGEGAAQAGLALATEGAVRAVPRAIGTAVRATKPIAGAGLRGVGDVVDPEITGIVSPRLAHVQRVAGRIGNAMREEPTVYPGAHLPENPGVFPGAHLPEAPPPEVLQARPLAHGARPIADPAAGLGEIPMREEPAVPPLNYPPEAPRVIARPEPNPGRARFLEDKGAQEEIRDAAEREDQSRLSQERREWFARNQPGSTKAELTGQADKPVTLTRGKPTGPRGISEGTPATDDLTPILRKSVVAAKKAKGKIAKLGD